jgi:hypothetical protein
MYPPKTWKSLEICICRGDFDSVLDCESGQLRIRPEFASDLDLRAQSFVPKTLDLRS